MLDFLNRLTRYCWPFCVKLWDLAILVALGAVICVEIPIALDNSRALDEKNIYLASFGGLVLSILTLYSTTLRPFLRKPRLVMFADRQWSEPQEANDTGSWFYRFRIENYGLAVAENCVGRLIGVWTADHKQIRKFDPLYLYWARQGKVTAGQGGQEIVTFEPIDIQGYGDFYFLDLAQLKKDTLCLRVVIPPPQTLTQELDGSPSPGNMPVLKLPGTYYLHVGVYAKDAHIQPAYLKLSCTEIKLPLSSTHSPCEIQKAWGVSRMRSGG